MCVHDSCSRTMLIMKSLGINFPIIKALGCAPSKLMVLKVNEGELKRITDLLSDKYTPKLDPGMSKKQLREILVENTMFAIYPYTPGKKNDEFVSELCRIAKVGTIQGDEVMVCPLVITECIIPEFAHLNIFSIYWHGNSDSLALKERDAVPPDDQIPVVCNKMHDVICVDHNTEERALLAATCFLYPNLSVIDPTGGFHEWVEVVREMVRQDEDNKEVEGVADMFVHELYSWQEKICFSDMYALPYLDMRTVEKLEWAIFYDDTYVYMKERLFKNIVRKLLSIFAVDVLKKKLVEADILCADATNTYTVKMTFFDIAGQFHRERMLRFNRKKLVLLGELEFIDLCQDRKEKACVGFGEIQGQNSHDE